VALLLQRFDRESARRGTVPQAQIDNATNRLSQKKKAAGPAGPAA
jgi:hypothetical protein